MPPRRQRPIVGGLLEWALAAGADCLEVTEAIIAKLAAKENPQNVMAVFEQRWALLPVPRRRAGRRRMAGAGAGARSRQPRHHHSYGRCRRCPGCHADRYELRSLLAGSSAGDDGLDLQRAGGTARSSHVSCNGWPPGPAMLSAPTCQARTISERSPTARRPCSSWAARVRACLPIWPPPARAW